MPQVTDPEILKQLNSGTPAGPQKTTTTSSGGVYIPPSQSPMQQRQEQREDVRVDISQQSEARQQRGQEIDVAKSTFNVLTPEEVASLGLNPGSIYQRNEFGQVTEIGKAVKQPDLTDAVAELKNVIQAARDAKKLSKEGWFATGALTGVFGDIPGTAGADLRGKLNTIGANIAFNELQKMRENSPTGGALGNVTEMELNLLRDSIASLDPSQSDEEFQRSMDTVIRSYERVLNKLEPEGKAKDGERPADIPPSVWDVAKPAERQAMIEGKKLGERYSNEQDMELHALLEPAYNSGASLEELNKIAADFGRPTALKNIKSQAELDRARKEGRPLAPATSGTVGETEATLGLIADSPVGAFFMGASNAIFSGFTDEIGSALGMDGDFIQLAKENYREKYPISSFVGEVAGGAGQFAAGAGALGAAGVGARGLAAGEIAQGALYGAGEANENRLVGAVTGGLAAAAGQQLGERVLSPLAQRIMGNPQARQTAERAAQEAGISVDDAAEIAAAQLGDEEADNLLAQAIRGKSAAQRELAESLQPNPEAVAAAERMGVDLPVDVMADQPAIGEIVGLGRSQIGSPARVAWRETSADAAQKFTQALEDMGATNLGQVGADVRDRMERTSAALGKQADELSKEVDAVVPKTARIDAEETRFLLGQRISDLGGGAEGRKALTPLEKKLLAAFGTSADPKTPTYAAFNQLRAEIGDAAYKNKGPWKDETDALLRDYYSQMKQDRLDLVEVVAGAEVKDKLIEANRLFSLDFDNREKMQALFQKSLQGDLSTVINRAITGASKGGEKDLNVLLENVPEDMRAGVVLSGILNAARGRSGSAAALSEGADFSAAKFVSMYKGLRDNAPAFAKFAKVIGPDGVRVLNDVFSLSKRIARAEGNITGTGASTQPGIAAIEAQSLLTTVIEGGKSRLPTVAAGAAGTMVGGPAGAILAGSAAEVMQSSLPRNTTSNLEKVHDLLSSRKFQQLIEKSARGRASDSDLRSVAFSKEGRKYARSVLGGEPNAFFDMLKSVMGQTPQSGAVVTGMEITGQTEQPTGQPAEVM